jgi:hypothetical protein
MASLPPDPLGQAAALLRAGQMAQARALLAGYVRQRPESANAWFLLSHAIPDAAQQRECLERALSLDPGHAAARERLAELGSPRAAWPPAPDESGDWGMSARSDEPPPAVPGWGGAAPAEPAAAAEPAPSNTIDDLRRAFMAREAEAPPPPEQTPRPSLRLSLPSELPVKVPPRLRALFFRHARTVVALLGAGILCLIGAYFLPRLLNPIPRVVAIIPTFTPTPVVFPTLPPEWTATPTAPPTGSPAPTATRTPTITPTFAPLDAAVLRSMDEVAEQVSILRGLEALADTERYLISRARVEDVLSALVLDAERQAALQDEALALAALGLLPPGYDLARHALNHAADHIGGFYVPGAGQLFIIGGEFGGVERFIFAHEVTHALQDQHFGLNDLRLYPRCARGAQACAALRALVEGDATLVMSQWLDQFATPQDFRDIVAYEPPAQTVPETSPPPYILKDLSFPYEQGLTFVTALYQRGNWPEVNQAYTDRPLSTEQILHPQKYLAGEPPLVVTDRPLADALGPGWRRVAADSLGEWTTYLLLAHGADPAARLADEKALAATTGWGGDAYQVYANPETRATALAVHWVWDTQRDADEFLLALVEHLSARFRGAAEPRGAGNCWALNGQTACVYSAGPETLWLLAPGDALLDQALALYPAFQ